MSTKKLNGLTLPEDVRDYIKTKAAKEHRSIANVIAVIVIDYVNAHSENQEDN